jgi:hypothetical protein
MTITLTDNAAFGTDRTQHDSELARILHGAADRIWQQGIAADGFPLLDINGNTVGKVVVS